MKQQSLVSAPDGTGKLVVWEHYIYIYLITLYLNGFSPQKSSSRDYFELGIPSPEMSRDMGSLQSHDLANY